MWSSLTCTILEVVLGVTWLTQLRSQTNRIGAQVQRPVKRHVIRAVALARVLAAVILPISTPEHLSNFTSLHSSPNCSSTESISLQIAVATMLDVRSCVSLGLYHVSTHFDTEAVNHLSSFVMPLTAKYLVALISMRQ